MRMVIPVGSVHEHEHERGVAHFVEHLCFAGSQHFAKGEILQFTDSIGSALGADVNALTHYDKTEFFLIVPLQEFKHSPGVCWQVINTALAAFADIAGRALCQGDAIEAERTIIEEEQRLGRTAEARDAMAMVNALLDGTEYAAREPIGTEAVVMHGSQQMIRNFYRRHYQRAGMGLFVAGDVPNVAALESLIHAHFSQETTQPEVGGGTGEQNAGEKEEGKQVEENNVKAKEEGSGGSGSFTGKGFKEVTHTTRAHGDSSSTTVSIIMRQEERQGGSRDLTIEDEVAEVAKVLLELVIDERLRSALERSSQTRSAGGQGISRGVWSHQCGADEPVSRYRTMQLQLVRQGRGGHTTAHALRGTGAELACGECGEGDEATMAVRLLMVELEMLRRHGVRRAEVERAKMRFRKMVDEMAPMMHRLAPMERIKILQDHWEKHFMARESAGVGAGHAGAGTGESTAGAPTATVRQAGSEDEDLVAGIASDQAQLEVARWILEDEQRGLAVADVEGVLQQWVDGAVVICFVSQPASTGYVPASSGQPNQMSRTDLARLWAEVSTAEMLKPVGGDEGVEEGSMYSVELPPTEIAEQAKGRILRKEWKTTKLSTKTERPAGPPSLAAGSDPRSSAPPPLTSSTVYHLSNGMSVALNMVNTDANFTFDRSADGEVDLSFFGVRVRMSTPLNAGTGSVDMAMADARDGTGGDGVGACRLATTRLSAVLAAACGYG
jgi:hypothetical protein